ncbi:MAG: hypothetical protein AAGD38_19680 [Acidobacteriota bacterium]
MEHWPIYSPKLVDDLEPIEVVGSEAPGGRICVFTIHDGDQVPRRALRDSGQDVFNRRDIRTTYVTERDWGANLVAEKVAEELGLGGYMRVNLARVLVDYGRFPGVSGNGVPYLDRKSVYPPLADLISEETKHQLITRYYDGISRRLTERFSHSLITLGIHTYDPRNQSGTMRSEVSLVTRSMAYQESSSIPAGVFDPLFPAILCESTAAKSLTYRIVLGLEQAHRDVALNHPYVMPEGSVEIRAQVWFFFRHLRHAFTAAFPETQDDPAYQRVWQMLLDVTRRSSDCETLRGYLHEYREAPHGFDELYRAARQAYAKITRFLDADRAGLINEYRFSRERPSCIGIEVRKDLLFDVDPGRLSVRQRPDAEAVARDIAVCLADGVRKYCDECYPDELPPARRDLLTSDVDGLSVS